MAYDDIDAGAGALGSETPAPSSTPSPEPSREQADRSWDDSLGGVWDKAADARETERQERQKRDEGGRFASGKEPGEGDPAATEGDTPVGTAAPAEAAKPLAASTVEPPHGWSAEQRANWAKIPPEVQPYIAQRELEVQRAITRYGHEVQRREVALRSWQPVNQVLHSYAQDFQRRGLQPHQAMGVLFEAQRKLDADPAGAITEIAATYGIDLRGAFQHGHPAVDGNGQPITNDPRTQLLQRKIDMLEGELGRVTGHLTQRGQYEARQRQQAQQAEHQRLTSEVQAFEKDHPHLKDPAVRQTAAALLESNVAKDLGTAHDMAINAVPAIRARIQSDQRAKAEAERLAAARVKAGQAQRAAQVNVRGSPGSRASPKSMDDTLNDAADRLYAR